MSIEARRNNNKTNLKIKIIETAIEIITERGFERFTIRELAAAIDYSPRTIYLYFKNKKHLMHAIIEKVFSETLVSINQNTSDNLELDNIMRSIIHRHMRNALSNPGLYRAIVTELSSPDYIQTPSDLKVKNQISIFLQQKSKKFNHQSTLISDIIFSELRSITLLLLNKSETMQKEEISDYIDLSTEILLRGIL